MQRQLDNETDVAAEAPEEVLDQTENHIAGAPIRAVAAAR
jgi:hypothetical protein